MIDAQRLAERFGPIRSRARGVYRINCPVHGGTGRNLMVSDKEGKNGKPYIGFSCCTGNCKSGEIHEWFLQNDSEYARDYGQKEGPPAWGQGGQDKSNTNESYKSMTTPNISNSVKAKYDKSHKPTSAQLDQWAKSEYGVPWQIFKAAGCSLQTIPLQEYGGEFWAVKYPMSGPQGEGGKLRTLDRLKHGTKREARHLPGGAGFFPAGNLKGEGPLIITAGEEKALGLIAAGVRAVSASCGEGGLSDELCHVIVKYGNNQVILAMDGDEAGQAGTVKSYVNLKRVGIESTYIPFMNGDDVNDYLKREGIEGIKEAVEAAMPAADLEEWPDIVPLSVEIVPDPFPLECLEGTMHRQFVEAISEYCECPVDLAITQSFATVAAVIQSKARWNVNHLEMPCIYAVGLAASGDRKSGIERACSDPLKKIQMERNRSYQSDMAANADASEIRSSTIKKLKSEASRAKDHSQVAAKLAIIQELRDQESDNHPPQPLIATEATGPGIKRAMMRPGSNETIYLADSEGRAVEILFGGAFEKGDADQDIITKAYSADQCHGLRGKEDSVQGFIQSPTLSIGLIVQVGMMEKFLKNESSVYKGTLARFLFCWPESMAGKRTLDTQRPDKVITEWWEKFIRNIFDHNPDKDQYGNRGWFDLGAEPEAVKVWRTFMQEIEPGRDAKNGQFALDGEAMLTWAGKLEGHVIRIAIALHVLKHASGYSETMISAKTMKNAVKITRYYMSHTRRVFLSQDFIRPGIADAKRLLVYLLNTAQKFKRIEVTLPEVRDAGLRHWDETRRDEAIKLLQDAGYIKVEVIKRKSGGRPKHLYRLNPTVINRKDHTGHTGHNPYSEKRSAPAKEAIDEPGF